MKTLKQLLQDHYSYNGCTKEGKELLNWGINTQLNIVIKWLEQKRLEYLEANRVFSIIAIDELLKELKQ